MSINLIFTLFFIIMGGALTHPMGVSTPHICYFFLCQKNKNARKVQTTIGMTCFKKMFILAISQTADTSQILKKL